MFKHTKHFDCCCPRCLDVTEEGTYPTCLLCSACGGRLEGNSCISCNQSLDTQRIEQVCYLSLRFKIFSSSLTPTLRPDLRPNPDTSLAATRSTARLMELGPMKIKPTIVENESCSNKNPECANSYHENLPNRILNRFFEVNSLENKMQLESESASRK